MGISTYAANVRDNTQRLHCDCMFPINAHRHDMIHQGALIAPRPLLMTHGRKDRLFPVAGYEEFEKTGRQTVQELRSRQVLRQHCRRHRPQGFRLFYAGKRSAGSTSI